MAEGNTLLITGAVSQLHEITGMPATNAVNDFWPAERFTSVFFKFQAGPAGLEVPESALSFLDATGVRRFAWLPWIKLDPGAHLIAAPSAAGAFYFEPDDTPLGRAGAEPVLLPQSRARPPAIPWRVPEGFRVELVAGGLALPVQVAAVPSPADAPDAPRGLHHRTPRVGQGRWEGMARCGRMCRMFSISGPTSRPPSSPVRPERRASRSIRSRATCTSQPSTPVTDSSTTRLCGWRATTADAPRRRVEDVLRMGW